MARYLRSLLLALLVFTVSASFALAWPGGAPRQVSVSGPGLKGQVVVSEPALMIGLGPEQFVDFVQPARPAAGLSNGFIVTRYTREDPSSPTEWVDRFAYYPHPSGGRGYVQYLGSEQGGGEAFKDKWFYPTDEGNIAILKLLKSIGATVDQSQNLPAGEVLVVPDAATLPQSTGRAYKVGFALSRQGKPISLGDPLMVYAVEAGATSQTVFSAHPEGATGHYVAEVNLPREGLWYWVVDLGTLDGQREMSPWRIGAGAPAAEPAPAQSPSSAPAASFAADPMMLASATAMFVLIGLALVWVTTRRWQTER